jgi:hypothetical protein
MVVLLRGGAGNLEIFMGLAVEKGRLVLTLDAG